MVSDKDIRDIAREADLTNADLHNLYGVLVLSDVEIENQERIADTGDFMLQAERVLTYWRQKNGKEATRNTLLNALLLCDCYDAMKILEDRWISLIEGRHALVLATKSILNDLI